jgi:nicotinate-nucleotide pyrophosphorylase (carboxylating)
MAKTLPPQWRTDVEKSVRLALEEDIGSGDISAKLIPATAQAKATVITRENAVICGQAWVNEVFSQVDPSLHITWHCQDGDRVNANQVLFSAEGSARSLLTAERSALNYLQLLSGTATLCQRYADLVAGTGVKLLDTRKTIPGLRTAQKYAVICGDCFNHRIGLYDAYLIKENHIKACGSIAAAVTSAKTMHPGKPVEVEVENMAELEQAISAGADTIMLDNFDLDSLRQAVKLTAGAAKLEASGGITKDSLRPIAETGVDYISIGALTKDCKAIDLSMRLT